MVHNFWCHTRGVFCCCSTANEKKKGNMLPGKVFPATINCTPSLVLCSLGGLFWEEIFEEILLFDGLENCREKVWLTKCIVVGNFPMKNCILI